MYAQSVDVLTAPREWCFTLNGSTSRKVHQLDEVLQLDVVSL
jgi:hypothetical protein